jgi:hypothetical protein
MNTERRCTTSGLPLANARTGLRIAAAGLGLSLAMSSATAAVLAGWDVHSLPGGVNAFGTSPLPVTTADANLTITGVERGTGVGTTGTAAARGWGGNDWISASAAAAVTAGDTVSFAVEPKSGYQVSITSISQFGYRRSSTGPASGVLQVQIGSGTYADVAALNYSSTASGGASLAAIDLSGITALQNVPTGTKVTFRIVNFGSSATGGTWYLFDVANTAASDLEISGIVSIAGPAVNGACGSANGQSFASVPTTNLCTAGTPSAVTGIGPWAWSCVGINGGTTQNCSASGAPSFTCPGP